MVAFFTGRRLEILQKNKPLYKQHQDAQTLAQFWPLVVEEYLAEFPEDDKPTPQYERLKTNSGKKSMKRPEGIEKPIREVLWFVKSMGMFTNCRCSGSKIGIGIVVAMKIPDIPPLGDMP